MRVVALFLGVALAGGCATRRGASVNTELVKQGGPSVDLSGHSNAASGPLQDYMKMIRHLSVRPVMREGAGANAESRDPLLAAALGLAAANPSAANHLRVGQEYFRLNVLDSSYTYVNRALLQEPRLAGAHEMLARIWRDWGFPGLGIGPATRAVYFDRSSAQAENTLGTILDAVGQPKEALRAFARAAALDPSAAWALNNLCFVELRMGRLADARSHCEAALDVDPTMIAAHNNLALTFVASGDPAGARQAFLAAGNPAGAAYNRGIVHMASRQYLPAAKAFEEAIAARPTFSAAKARAHEARMLAITSSHD
jgi:tetratricopeptide (TPR) repeat protein